MNICHIDGSTVPDALCRSCLRPVCKACAAEVEFGLACPGKCEEYARAITRLTRRGIAGMTVPASNDVGTWLLVLMLLLCSSPLLYVASRSEVLPVEAVLVGVAGLLWGSAATFALGGLHNIRSRRIARRLDSAAG